MIYSFFRVSCRMSIWVSFARWARWLNMGPTWPNISPRWAQDASTWARLGPTWAQPALNIGPDCFHTGKHCALCLPQFNIALPGFARRISAQSSHTISQTSLLGRRPAVRPKPLNPRAGHEASPCPCRRPSVVTEGYRHCRPCRRPTPCSPRGDSQKHRFFLRCFGPLGSKGFHLGDVTKPWFFTWLWAPGGGPERKNWHLKIVST